jgi:hypothetical protein
MPRLNGIETATLIRQFCLDCRVVLLCGQTVTMDLMDAAQKPIHPQTLLAHPRSF